MEKGKLDLDFDLEALLDDDEIEEVESNFRSIIEDKNKKWVFVGGKGGVGKTTISSALSLILAKNRKSVLLISTDPAHNLSDIFLQKFNGQPSLLKGHKNLYIMEIDTKELDRKIPENNIIPKEFMNEIGQNIPGIDEIGTFLEIMKQVRKMDFDTIVFDTAPTGHTLRLLSIPDMMDKGIGKYMGAFSKVYDALKISSDQVEETTNTIKEVKKQFRDPKITTFVCVCIPSFLSVYETERLIQELMKCEIHCENIVVNQCFPKNDHCKFCQSQYKIQSKYIGQIDELYKGFHVLKIPLFEEEVKSVSQLETLFKYFLPNGENEKN